MTRSEVRATVRIKVKTDVLTAQKKKRLGQITGRDTRTIRHYLKVIYHNEHIVVKRRKGTKKVNKTKLDQLTLTTSKKTVHLSRTTVRHDLKQRFPRSSQDELQECRDTAVAIVHSQQALETAPNTNGLAKKIPRTQSANKNRFKLECVPNNSIARWWVGIRDSLDTYHTPSPNHKRLWLPLACAPYHEHKLKQGKIKALELLYYPKKKEWWIHFIVSHTPKKYASSRPPAVLGIDLGINKRAVSALLTPKGTINRHEIRFWSDKTRKEMIKRNEKRIADLQRKLADNALISQQRQALLRKLKVLRRKKQGEHKLTDHTYVNKLVKYILSLGSRYDLFVVVGFPVHIRKSHYRGNQRPTLRKKVHKWNYRRVIELLKFKLSLHGWKEHRVLALSESWTSSTCSRCGSYHTLRPTQPSFLCQTCSYQLNADLNAAKNIAKRLIKYVLQPKYSSIKDLLTEEYHSLTLFSVFPVLSQWL